MPNRYTNLDGNAKISETYTQITDGFTHVQQDIDADRVKLDGIEVGAGTPGSATDSVIGNRTATDSVTPGFTGTLTALLSSLFSLIKGITGKSSALTAPATTLEETKAHMDNTDVHMTAAEHTKLSGIAAGAQVNQPAFSVVNDVDADDPEDTLTIAGGTGITISTNTATKTLTVTATGTATPGAHASSHITGGADVIPDAVAGGASGLMSGADKTKVNGAIQATEKGVASGVATLDASIKLPAAQLPSSAVQATTAGLTYYVRTDGNDNNNGLANTAAGAFKTIGKAISMIPPVVNHNVIINVAAGTYDEVVNIAGRGGSATLQLNGDSVLSASRSVHSIFVANCSCRVEVVGFTGYRNDGEAFSAKASAEVLFYRDSVTNAAPTSPGFYAEDSSVMLNECQASNRMVGVYAHVNGQILAYGMTGTGCTVGYRAAFNGEITVQSSTLTAAGSLADTQSGGTVHTQSGVLNPWGDNTAAQRSYIFSRISADQAITASAFTKVAFDSAFSDHLGEYSAANRRFTAKKSGIYLVEAGIQSTGSTPAGAVVVMSVYKNGGRYRDIGTYVKSGAIGEILTQGAVSMELTAGEYIEIWVFTNVSGMVLFGNIDGILSHFTVTQIA
ncbi:hypothetical protein D3C75_538250 [compost metagenome]